MILAIRRAFLVWSNSDISSQNGKWKQHNVMILFAGFWCLPCKKPYLAWSIMFIALWTTTNAAMNAAMIWQNILLLLGTRMAQFVLSFILTNIRIDDLTTWPTLAIFCFWSPEWPSTKPRSLLEVIDGFKPQNGRIILKGCQVTNSYLDTEYLFEPFASLEVS